MPLELGLSYAAISSRWNNLGRVTSGSLRVKSNFFEGVSYRSTCVGFVT
jgi:hypothetical protein